MNTLYCNQTCEMEDKTLFDPYAVVISEKGSNVIGHNIPHKISAACSLFLERNVALEIIDYDLQFTFA